jgi:hypothetical protein
MATDSSLTPAPAPPVSPVNTAVGQQPSPNVLKAAKGAIPPDRGDDHPNKLNSADSPPTLDPSLLASPVTAVGQHPFPKVLKAAKDAILPGRGDGHLDFRSEGTENINGARGDPGCGLSAAQATAQKTVFNQANNDDADMATFVIIPISSSSSPLPLHSGSQPSQGHEGTSRRENQAVLLKVPRRALWFGMRSCHQTAAGSQRAVSQEGRGTRPGAGHSTRQHRSIPERTQRVRTKGPSDRSSGGGLC